MKPHAHPSKKVNRPFGRIWQNVTRETRQCTLLWWYIFRRHTFYIRHCFYLISVRYPHAFFDADTFMWVTLCELSFLAKWIPPLIFPLLTYKNMLGKTIEKWLLNVAKCPSLFLAFLAFFAPVFGHFFALATGKKREKELLSGQIERKQSYQIATFCAT